MREPLEAGREIAGFRLERPLGQGRNVWLARDRAGRAWALKTAPPPLIAHEARLLSALIHPRIVRLEAVVAGGEASFLVLEHLPGGSLVGLAGASPSRWLGPVADLVAALEYLHGEGIVHRDLKARNVLLGDDERARLIDFGSAAKIGSVWTDAGTTAETVAADRRGAPVGPADDLHALAALLHEMLYAAPPGAPARRQPPAFAAPLAAAVAGCLGSREAAGRLGLAGFRTVIESCVDRHLTDR